MPGSCGGRERYRGNRAGWILASGSVLAPHGWGRGAAFRLGYVVRGWLHALGRCGVVALLAVWGTVSAQVGVVDPDAAYSALLVVSTSAQGKTVTHRARVYREPGRLRFEDLDGAVAYVFRYDRRRLWILRDPSGSGAPPVEQLPLKDGLGIAPFIDEFLFAEDPFTGRLSRAFGMDSPRVIDLGEESREGRSLRHFSVETPHWRKGESNVRHIWVDPRGVVVKSRLETADGQRSFLELRELRVGVQPEGVFEPEWRADLREGVS